MVQRDDKLGQIIPPPVTVSKSSSHPEVHSVNIHVGGRADPGQRRMEGQAPEDFEKAALAVSGESAGIAVQCLHPSQASSSFSSTKRTL